MLDKEQILSNRYPLLFSDSTHSLSSLLVGAFRLLFHEREINLFLPVDNLGGSSQKEQIKAIQNALLDEQAVTPLQAYAFDQAAVMECKSIVQGLM